MKRHDAIDLLDNLVGMVDDNQGSDYDTALKMGIADMRKMAYITDRPCAVCKLNEDGNGCKKWNCVFEEDK